MGMDVVGLAPTAEVGEYFRNNIWWWHPLASYLTATYPDLTAGCEYWGSNDGDGLNAAEAIALAAAVQRDVADGSVAAAAAEFAAQRRDIPVRFSVENVAAFADFAAHSGGFAIW